MIPSKALAALLAGLAIGSAAADDAAEGEKLYRSQCQMCHGRIDNEPKAAWALPVRVAMDDSRSSVVDFAPALGMDTLAFAPPFGPNLRGVVGRIVRNRDDVEDVIHDAFVQILKDARSFDPARGSARAWIYTIVRNTALKRCRSAGREIAIEDDELLALHDRILAEPASRTAEYAALRGYLEALEPRRRASLILAIIDGRTHAEVAAYLGVPLGTVKSWIRRELVALRAQLFPALDQHRLRAHQHAAQARRNAQLPLHPLSLDLSSGLLHWIRLAARKRVQRVRTAGATPDVPP